MAQQLRLAEDLGLIPRTRTVAHNHLQPQCQMTWQARK